MRVGAIRKRFAGPSGKALNIVFHPHFDEAEPTAILRRVLPILRIHFTKSGVVSRRRESCYFATVNCASAGSPTTSAIVGLMGHY